MGKRSAKVQRRQQKKYTPPVPIVPRVRPKTDYVRNVQQESAFRFDVAEFQRWK